MRRASALALALVAPAVARADRPAPTLPALAVPATWTEQPTVADAARTAMGAGGQRARAVAAWGDPVKGCFATAVAIELAAGEAPTRFGDELRAALAAGLTVDGWTVEPGGLRARLSRQGWHGQIRARVTTRTGGRATVVACFYNDRAPARCAAACDAVLASPSLAVTP